MQEDKSNEPVVGTFVVGKGLPPNALSIDYGNKSAILLLGGWSYDLREIDISKYDYLIINGVSYKKEQK